MKKSGNNTGLYCGDCGAWIKWLNRNEVRLAQRQIEMNEKELDRLIESLPDYTTKSVFHREVINCQIYLIF